jgi:hypothetical protein
VFSIVACLVAAAASLLRGRPYYAETPAPGYEAPAQQHHPATVA